MIKKTKKNVRICELVSFLLTCFYGFFWAFFWACQMPLLSALSFLIFAACGIAWCELMEIYEDAFGKDANSEL